MVLLVNRIHNWKSPNESTKPTKRAHHQWSDIPNIQAESTFNARPSRRKPLCFAILSLIASVSIKGCTALTGPESRALTSFTKKKAVVWSVDEFVPGGGVCGNPWVFIVKLFGFTGAPPPRLIGCCCH